MKIRLAWAAALLVASGCAAPSSAPRGAPATPTPGPLSRTNPNIVEEDDVHIVERYPKEQYIRVDDRHIKHPLIASPVEFFKEDDKYYYVYTFKRSAEMNAAERLRRGTPTPVPATSGGAGPTPTPGGPPLSDFDDLLPPRVSGRIRLEEIPDSGLPVNGLWRASFAIADVNGDGIPDIIAPPGRLSDARLHIWLGDGHGHFSEWPLRFLVDGKIDASFSVDYGGVAVGDIDGDGHQDIVVASHGAGLVSLFGDGQGTFRVVRTGLPTRDFSAQAVALVDADGDGKLDIVASRDVVPADQKVEDQLRVYLYRGSSGWQYKPDGLTGGFYSYSMAAWDFDGDGRPDILTGSHFIGALTLLWKNEGNGTFSPVRFPGLEIYSYHFASAAGTFGKRRMPAFADAYAMLTNEPQPARAQGISIYSYESAAWTRHRVWRKNSGRSVQYGLAMGDLDGDGLDDLVFLDSDTNRLRVFFQNPDGRFVELAENEEPLLDSPGQCVRLVDLDRDGRLDIVISKTVASYRPNDPGGWKVYRNRAK